MMQTGYLWELQYSPYYDAYLLFILYYCFFIFIFRRLGCKKWKKRLLSDSRMSMHKTLGHNEARLHVAHRSVERIRSDGRARVCEATSPLRWVAGFGQGMQSLACPGSWTHMFGTKWAFFLKFYMKGTFHGTKFSLLISWPSTKGRGSFQLSVAMLQ